MVSAVSLANAMPRGRKGRKCADTDRFPRERGRKRGFVDICKDTACPETKTDRPYKRDRRTFGVPSHDRIIDGIRIYGIDGFFAVAKGRCCRVALVRVFSPAFRTNPVFHAFDPIGGWCRAPQLPPKRRANKEERVNREGMSGAAHFLRIPSPSSSEGAAQGRGLRTMRGIVPADRWARLALSPGRA
jgi:hypothetical protein